jgi:hypothetical protein
MAHLPSTPLLIPPLRLFICLSVIVPPPRSRPRYLRISLPGSYLGAVSLRALALRQAQSGGPSPRAGHGFAAKNGKLYVFGGYEGLWLLGENYARRARMVNGYIGLFVTFL